MLVSHMFLSIQKWMGSTLKLSANSELPSHIHLLITNPNVFRVSHKHCNWPCHSSTFGVGVEVVSSIQQSSNLLYSLTAAVTRDSKYFWLLIFLVLMLTITGHCYSVKIMQQPSCIMMCCKSNTISAYFQAPSPWHCLMPMARRRDVAWDDVRQEDWSLC